MSTTHTIHPLWLRLTHWINMVAVVILVMSGWQIYNASPVFHSFRFSPAITLGQWLGGALLWHFAAMWVLFANSLSYLLLNIVSGRLVHKFFPIRPADAVHDFLAALKGKLVHNDPSHYNTLQKLAYLFVMADTTVTILSGLVVWKSVQFPHLRELMGGYDNARIVHFLGMSGLVAFLLVHLIMVAIVPRTLLTMIRGR
jgi:thiosulfate reductase cytochrome b subunit